MDTTNSPFTIIIDNQEKNPILFQHVYLTNFNQGRPHHTHVIVSTVRQHLPTGDYSIRGYEESIAFERKSLADLQRSITHQKGRAEGRHNRNRFERELERLQNFAWSAVIVEGNWEEFLKYCLQHTSMSPVAANASIIAYQHRFQKTHWIWCPRQAQAKLMYQHFARFLKDKELEHVALG